MSKSNDLKIQNGHKTVTTAGTREPLMTGQDARVLSVTIKALSTNTDLVYVGDSTVASTNGFELAANETVSFSTEDPNQLINLSSINLDVAVNGEGVSFIYVRA